MPTLPASNTFEGGTNGTTLTVANTGGDSGDALSEEPTIGASCTLTFSSDLGDGLAAKYVMPATAAATHMSWTGFGALTVPVFYRWELQKDGTPSATWFDMLRVIDSSGTRAATLAVTTADFLRSYNAAGAAIAGGLGDVAIPNNQKVRIEAKVTPSATAGEVEWRLFLDPTAAVDSTPDDTTNVTGQVLGANVGGGRWGLISGATGMNGRTWYVDNIAASTTDWIGPAAEPPVWPPVDNPAAPPLRVARSNLRLA